MSRVLLGIGVAVLLGSSALAKPAEVGPRLQAALEHAPRGATELVWVFFRDKGPSATPGRGPAREGLTPRAVSRRALRGTLATDAGLEDPGGPGVDVDGRLREELPLRGAEPHLLADPPAVPVRERVDSICR